MNDTHYNAINDEWPFYSPNIGNAYNGWMAGGRIFNGTATSIVQRLIYANDTSGTSIRGPLMITMYETVGTSNGSDGWFYSGAVHSNFQRITYANDMTTASSRTQLIVTPVTGAGNYTDSWLWASTRATNLYRYQYSNDTSINLMTGTIPASNGDFPETVGNLTDMWRTGGASELVTRTTYATTTFSTSVRGSLGFGTTHAGSFGNNSYGWIYGGSNPSNGSIYYSNVKRIEYSNDLTLATGRAAIPQATTMSVAISNATDAWLSGGYTGSVTSSIFKVSLATDTSYASVSALTNAVYAGAAR